MSSVTTGALCIVMRRSNVLEHDVAPLRRSAIWTFVAPERPADFSTNTTTPDSSGYRGVSTSPPATH